MDRGEHGAVAGDLGLRSVARLAAPGNERLDPPARRGDVLDRVRCFDALDQRRLLQRLQCSRMLQRERLLAPAGDVDLAQLTIDCRRDEVEVSAQTAKRLHARKVQAQGTNYGFSPGNP
jgi:hypothetical protein